MNMQIVPALQGHEIPVAAVLVERCACCWSAAYPDQRYPLAWSSTLCPFHAAWTRERRRIAREQGGTSHA